MTIQYPSKDSFTFIKTVLEGVPGEKHQSFAIKSDWPHY